MDFVSTEVASFGIMVFFCAVVIKTYIEEKAKSKRDAAFQVSSKRHSELMRCFNNIFIQEELKKAGESAESVLELTHLKVEEVEEVEEPVAPVAPSTSRTIIDECVSLLVSMGHKKSDAKKKVNSLGGHKFDTTEEMLTAALSG
jgi:hypothetical protein